MSRSKVSGRFLQGARGSVFVLLREPAAGLRGCVLVVPPFAEEMNKSRRMLTEVGIRLAEQGIATILPDLFGTGDSGGELADADWACWQDDLRLASGLASGLGVAISGILAIRLGCALASSALESGAVPPVSRTVLWQPVFDGNRYLRQFLRLRTAAALMSGGPKESDAELRQRLRGGEVLEVAGYRLGGRLANDLESLQPLADLSSRLGAVHWMEVNRQVGPASDATVKRSGSAGRPVSSQVFVGEPFWAATEIVLIPELVDATVRAFLEPGQDR